MSYMRVERYQIKRSHRYFKEVDNLCLLAKNLRNKITYDLRQIFFHNQTVWETKQGEKQQYPSYFTWMKENKHDPDCTALPAAVTQEVAQLVFREWKSFWEALRSYYAHPERFKAKPQVPGYKHPATGRYAAIYRCRFEGGSAVRRNWDVNGIIRLTDSDLEITFRNFQSCKKLCQVRLVPNKGYHAIEIVYEQEITGVVPCGKHVAAIDPGLGNLMTVVTSRRDLPALIVPGGPVKAINAFYNKKLAKAKSELPEGVYSSKKINRLWRRRANKLKDYCHRAPTVLVNKLYAAEVCKVTIGHNEGQKQNVNLGKRTNQNFVQIPMSMVRSMLAYKLEDRGMSFQVTEESYTSKASALDNDKLFIHGDKQRAGYVFSGKRIKRGLYRTGDGSLMNADVNGAINILRKVTQNVPTDWVRGLLATPVRLQVSP